MRKLVFIQGSGSAGPSLPPFIWGEMWSYTFEFPEGATSCFLVDGALAAGVNQASTGSNEFSGYVVPGATTGETRFSLQFYLSLIHI